MTPHSAFWLQPDRFPRPTMRLVWIPIQAMVLLVASFAIVAPTEADWRDDIGWTQLKSERGSSLHDGTGVNVLQAEVPDTTGYHPYVNHPQFAGKSFTDATGTGNPADTSTGHSESVGFMFYGLTSSIAGDITDITIYEANDFVFNALGFSNDGGANFGTDPIALPFRVQSHAYVFGTSPSNQLATNDALELLHKIDKVVNDNNSTVVVGTNNGAANPTPQGYAHSYNTITVGRTDGDHAQTPTTFNGAGRVKPEIVAPFSAVLGESRTSWSTGMVSSAAAVLHDAADEISTNAQQNEVIKAQLLAGATKDEFATWDRTTQRPLDETFGAGELNIRNSYLIQEGGEFEGSTSAPSTNAALFGWDYNPTFDPADMLHYNFVIADGEIVDELSAILTWNLEVIDTDNSGGFNPSTTLANMDLELFDSSGSFLGSLVDESRSADGGTPNGNIEHIYLQNLSAGTYTFRISSDIATDFGFAWRITTLTVPEPGSGLVGAVAIVFCLFRRRR